MEALVFFEATKILPLSLCPVAVASVNEGYPLPPCLNRFVTSVRGLKHCKTFGATSTIGNYQSPNNNFGRRFGLIKSWHVSATESITPTLLQMPQHFFQHGLRKYFFTTYGLQPNLFFSTRYVDARAHAYTRTHSSATNAPLLNTKS